MATVTILDRCFILALVLTSLPVVLFIKPLIYPSQPPYLLRTISLQPHPVITSPADKLFFLSSLQLAIAELSNLSSLSSDLIPKYEDERVKSALVNCNYLLDDAVGHLNDSIASFNSILMNHQHEYGEFNDIRTWLSTAVTDQETCLDGVREYINNSNSKSSSSAAAEVLLEELRRLMKNELRRLMKNLANSLAIFTDQYRIGSRGRIFGEFPYWLHPDDRRIFQEDNLKPDATVAKDGSGDYETIAEAVAMVPKENKNRFLIYVKQGNYSENVIVDKHKWNVMIYGDGMTGTIVSGSLNFMDGAPTFSTATFVADGKGFIARDMGFENTAGPAKNQAVALRSGSDRSVFFRCSFDSFQGTLYTHSNRQLYRHCNITGTVDFIFGKASFTFQSCNIVSKRQEPSQDDDVFSKFCYVFSNFVESWLLVLRKVFSKLWHPSPTRTQNFH